MEYQYKIPTFEEAVSIVEREKGFSHSVQEIHGKEVHSFKYNISHKEMWEDLSDGRLNMRGTTFIDGELVCLPPWKFFNIGEVKHATYPKNEKYLMEKLDGSLINCFLVDGFLEVKTMKSVYSDVAVQARKYFQTRGDIRDFSKSLLDSGLSPYFEYVGPHNRIVLRYDSENLVFLGARCMTSGRMVFPWGIMVPDSITIPRLVEDKDSYLKRDDVEGLVVVGTDGHMVKCKTSTYCQLHKILDMKTNKAFCEYYNEHGNFDDVIGVLTHHGLNQDINDLLQFEDDYSDKMNHYMDLITETKSRYEHLSRKGIALNMIGDKVPKEIRGLVFSALDGKDFVPKIKRLILESYKDERREDG
jgi:T4 RnlA family RNA ligase